ESIFANLNSQELQDKLESDPLVASARVLKERPNTLDISVTARLPLAFVKMENDLGEVYPPEPLFVDKSGTLFPVSKEQHALFMKSPTWYLKSPDVNSFQVGERIHTSSSKPVIELLKTLLLYNETEIPSIKSIRCPKEWKIVLSLETGTEVMMKTSDIPAQLERLYQLLEHAKSSNRRIRSANVVPSVNPAVTFFD
ncbi:MAG: FtsQ-type POTRA domain-containing protein, partial [Akkermansia sp.]